MSSEPGSSKTVKTTSNSFDEYNAELQTAALNATKLSAGLPGDISFHRSVDHDFAQAIDRCSEKALSLSNRLLALVNDAEPARSSRAKGKKKLEDQEDVVDSFHTVVLDVLDQLFERADTCLDDYLGRSQPATTAVKPPRQQVQSATASSQTQKTSSTKLGRLDPAILHASHLPKPQLKFRRRADNTDDSKWTPGLKHKYNAQVPLGYELNEENVVEGSDGTQKRPHPYRYEINHISYPSHMFMHTELVPPRSFEETPFTWVDTPDSLQKLLDRLRVAKEIAVDLEHHSYRTFAGFLCLMQISTREDDFIIDTLALRDELEELNEIFTDPKIVKVFHGAESDIVWLQQDFNLYVVNLFDTFHASKVLDFPRHGLAALLTMYCDYIPDKRYQLADWRIRPLPEEMLNYARSDTHFLLFIYDSLRNALLDRAGGQPDLIHTVLKRSEETALRTYEKEVYDFENGSGPGGWETLASKWNKVLNGLQLEVFRAVHAWRDRVAREEDESTRYVLPNHYLFQLAERPPADMAALLAIFRPVPPLIRVKSTSLLETIRAAVKESLSSMRVDGPSQSTAQQEVSSDARPPLAEVQSTPEVATPSKGDTSVSGPAKSVLWTSQRPNIVATSSSLLCSGPSNPDTSPAFVSSDSSLFPSHVLGSGRASGSSTRYQEVVSRIHSALVVAPSAPKIDSETPNGQVTSIVSETETKTIVTEVESAAVAGDIEIPFIPASQRKATAAEIVEDTIIVVGKAKQKKRKRTKQPEQTDGEAKDSAMDGAARTKKSKKEAETQEDSGSPEPFDYASAPNFLDEPVREKSDIKTAKAQKKKGKTIEYGNFPAPPRAYSEVKGGSKSHTFR